MAFNSLSYLLFFPAACFVFFLLPARLKKPWLLACSLFFYMCWNVLYVLLLLFSILCTWGGALLLERQPRFRKSILWIVLGSDLGILFLFKYYSFFVENLNRLLGLAGLSFSGGGLELLLPVGISFYTFQSLGYMLDVYWGKEKAERNLLDYALFVSFFPQLVAGPIERGANLLPQFRRIRPFDWDRIRSGLALMLWGFFEKMIVADRAAKAVDMVYGNPSAYGGFTILLATFLFSFQVYCDFGGYSHIAIGSARVLGIELMDNFRRPFLSKSFSELWSRWHMSLNLWFRDYLYIPMGGSRRGRLRRAINLMTVFLVSGLWHGAAWTYVIWGGLNGGIVLLGGWLSGLLPRGLTENRNPVLNALRSLRTFVLFSFTVLFFRAAGLSQARELLSGILTRPSPDTLGAEFASLPGMDPKNMAVTLFALFLLVLAELIREHGEGNALIGWFSSPRAFPLRFIACGLMVMAILLFGAYGAEFDASKFIYFQF